MKKEINSKDIAEVTAALMVMRCKERGKISGL